jgi:hypothetical protein
VSVDDTRRAYATLARKIERYGRAHLRLGSVFTPAEHCGTCHLTGLAADAASLSLDNATALWWAGEYPSFAVAVSYAGRVGR